MMIARACALALGLVSSCFREPSLPGDARVGSFAFVATLSQDTCSIADVPLQLSFDATLTAEKATGHAFLTRPGMPSLPGTIDGRVFAVGTKAARVFDFACVCGEGATVTMEEDITARVFTAAESAALNGDCPADAPSWDGGSPPLFGDGGVDAVLVCGRLTDAVPFPEGCAPVDGGTSPCVPCALTYSLFGTRRQ